MISPHEDRGPDALHIAAFLDGEFDDQPQLADLGRRIREWLLDHPEAGAAALAQRRLARLMAATAAPEPSEAAWDCILARLEQAPAPASPARAVTRRWRPTSVAAVLLSAAAAVWVVLALGHRSPPAVVRPQPDAPAVAVKQAPEPRPAAAPKPQEVEVFPVATADEIEILRIGGADTRTVAVTGMPTLGPLELARPGEIVLTRAESEVRVDGSGPPVFWMRQTEEIEDPN